MLPQLLNRYLLLTLPLLVLAGWAVVLMVRRARRRWWLAWGGLGVVLVAGFFSLRTPAATVTEFRPAPSPAVEEAATETPSAESLAALVKVGETPPFTSAEEIRRFIASSGGKPTLVDFYTDFGLS
jgi:hypothetical protein